MKTDMYSEISLLERRYVSPAVVVISVEVEDTLATSNTEQIIEDNDEYGWD